MYGYVGDDPIGGNDPLGFRNDNAAPGSLSSPATFDEAEYSSFWQHWFWHGAHVTGSPEPARTSWYHPDPGVVDDAMLATELGMMALPALGVLGELAGLGGIAAEECEMVTVLGCEAILGDDRDRQGFIQSLERA